MTHDLWHESIAGMIVLSVLIIVIFLNCNPQVLGGDVFDAHSPCAEDEALYPVRNGELAYPEGTLRCVNIEELR